MALRPITDYEFRYKITGGSFVSPIACTALNTTDNGNGTYTVNVPDDDIATGDFQVRVKAIGADSASAWLSSNAPFTKTVVTPTVSFTTPSAMTFGDPDQTLTFSTTNPDVTAVATSLDITKATIVAGKLHAVGNGSVTIRVTSPASYGYAEVHNDKAVEMTGPVEVPTDYILCYDFNGDVLDKSASDLDGVKTGTDTYGTGYKGGTQCLDFAGGFIATPDVLPLTNNKVSLSFWAKTSQTGRGIIIELSNAFDSSTDTFGVQMNYAESNALVMCDSGGAGVNIRASASFNSGAWKHVVILTDRSLGTSETKIYINGVQDDYQASGWAKDNDGNFGSYKLYIGARNGGGAPFTGSLQSLKIYDRILNVGEIGALYAE